MQSFTRPERRVSGNLVPRPVHSEYSQSAGQNIIRGLIHNFIHCGLLVPTPSHDILVIVGDVAAQHGRGFLGYKDGGSVGSSPGV